MVVVKVVYMEVKMVDKGSKRRSSLGSFSVGCRKQRRRRRSKMKREREGEGYL